MHERTESFIEAEAAGHTWERRSTTPEDTHVLAHTHKWLNALPRGVRPVHLPAHFPRIANDLARLWPETSALDQYFEEKEFSPREDRHGFPPMIKEELLCGGRPNFDHWGAAKNLDWLSSDPQAPAVLGGAAEAE